MNACWLKMPVFAPGQLLKLTVTRDGAFFTSGFAVAVRRMQNVVFGLGPTRIEGSPGQRFPGPMMKPANELWTTLRFAREAFGNISQIGPSVRFLLAHLRSGEIWAKKQTD
jgi:hypothetical protein